MSDVSDLTDPGLDAFIAKISTPKRSAAKPSPSRALTKRNTRKMAGLNIPHLRTIETSSKEYDAGDQVLDMELEDTFKAIDLMLARHLRGDKTAKGDLQMLSAAIRLKISVFRTAVDWQRR